METLVCQHCHEQITFEYAEIDPQGRGFWCECDGYTYLPSEKNHHRFTLLLEDKDSINTVASSVKTKFQKRLSVLRYPGGKSKLIPYLFSKIQASSTNTLVSPFCGGASLELALLHAGVVKQLILNDLDFGVYALFWTMKFAPDELLYRIKNTLPTHKDYFYAQSIIKSDYHSCTILEAAWNLLLVNRLAYSGIYKANPLGGRHGTSNDLLSRWNPKDLSKRITQFNNMSDQITILNMDACDLIEEEYWRPSSTIFIDPPYVQKGEQLYRCYYGMDEHVRLNVLLDSLYHGMPGADIILTYDNDPLIENIYMYPTIEKISRI